jgi:hypothetical protein
VDVHIPKGLGPRPHPNKTLPKKSRKRLRVKADDQTLEVLDIWSGGFATAAASPRLTRGYVDLYEGPNLIHHGLAYLAAVEGDRRVYAFKQVRGGHIEAPLDHVRTTPAPVGLITSDRD